MKLTPYSSDGELDALNIMQADRLKIGEVADRADLSVKTVRYYADLGLLTPTIARSASGYRLFSADVLNRLAFIKRAQGLGLALEEIRTILTVHDQGDLPCGAVKQHLEDKLDAINQQLAALQTLKMELQGILSGWEDHPDAAHAAQTICPNLQTATRATSP